MECMLITSLKGLTTATFRVPGSLIARAHRARNYHTVFDIQQQKDKPITLPLAHALGLISCSYFYVTHLGCHILCI